MWYSYFEHPPQFQILHCLRNRVRGGASRFVDAVRVANALRAENPDAFELLATTPVAFHYINDGHHLHRKHTTIELARVANPGVEVGEVAYVNYSPPFQAPLPRETPAAFYDALRLFAERLEDPAGRYECTMREGDAVVFNNRCVLHARTAFSSLDNSTAGTGEPDRWLKGCYLDGDAIADRARMLRTELGGSNTE